MCQNKDRFPIDDQQNHQKFKVSFKRTSTRLFSFLQLVPQPFPHDRVQEFPFPRDTQDDREAKASFLFFSTFFYKGSWRLSCKQEAVESLRSLFSFLFLHRQSLRHGASIAELDPRVQSHCLLWLTILYRLRLASKGGRCSRLWHCYRYCMLFPIPIPPPLRPSPNRALTNQLLPIRTWEPPTRKFNHDSSSARPLFCDFLGQPRALCPSLQFGGRRTRCPKA